MNTTLLQFFILLALVKCGGSLSFRIFRQLFLSATAVNCRQDKDTGMNCDNQPITLKFYFDMRTSLFWEYYENIILNFDSDVCQPLFYRGCAGNDNRFDSREACSEACVPKKQGKSKKDEKAEKEQEEEEEDVSEEEDQSAKDMTLVGMSRPLIMMYFWLFSEHVQAGHWCKDRHESPKVRQRLSDRVPVHKEELLLSIKRTSLCSSRLFRIWTNRLQALRTVCIPAGTQELHQVLVLWTRRQLQQLLDVQGLQELLHVYWLNPFLWFSNDNEYKKCSDITVSINKFWRSVVSEASILLQNAKQHPVQLCDRVPSRRLFRWFQIEKLLLKTSISQCLKTVQLCSCWCPTCPFSAKCPMRSAEWCCRRWLAAESRPVQSWRRCTAIWGKTMEWGSIGGHELIDHRQTKSRRSVRVVVVWERPVDLCKSFRWLSTISLTLGHKCRIPDDQDSPSPAVDVFQYPPDHLHLSHRVLSCFSCSLNHRSYRCRRAIVETWKRIREKSTKWGSIECKHTWAQIRNCQEEEEESEWPGHSERHWKCWRETSDWATGFSLRTLFVTKLHFHVSASKQFWRRERKQSRRRSDWFGASKWRGESGEEVVMEVIRRQGFWICGYHGKQLGRVRNNARWSNQSISFSSLSRFFPFCVSVLWYCSLLFGLQNFIGKKEIQR